MVGEKPPIERRWRNVALLFLGICIACIIVAVILVPSNMKWGGIEVSTVIATIGSLAGAIGVLCAARLIILQLQSGDDD